MHLLYYPGEQTVFSSTGEIVPKKDAELLNIRMFRENQLTQQDPSGTYRVKKPRHVAPRRQNRSGRENRHRGEYLVPHVDDRRVVSRMVKSGAGHDPVDDHFPIFSR